MEIHVLSEFNIGTPWLGVVPMPSNDTEATAYALQRVVGPPCKLEFVYTVDPGECVDTAKASGWSAVHYISTHHRPQTNRIAERAVRRVKEGTRIASMQAGVHVEWWVGAMQCVGVLWITAFAYGRQSPCRLRFW